MLTEVQAERLEILRQNNEAAPPPFRVDGHWARVAGEFDVWFDLYGIDVAEEQVYNSHYAAYDPLNPAYIAYVQYMTDLELAEIADAYEMACLLVYQREQERDKWGLLSTVKTALPEESSRYLLIDGNAHTWDTLISIHSIITIANVYPDIIDKPCAVADLGGGWGRMGFVLKQINPACVYYDFDLPESLLVASTYLPTIMSTDLVCFKEAHELADVPDGFFDVFMNIASFQEMSLEQSGGYCKVLERVTDGFFYSLQAHQPAVYRFPSHWPMIAKDAIPWWKNYYEAVFGV